VVRLLIEAGADKDASTTDTRLTALHMACRTGNVAILRLLLEKGAQSQRQDALEL
jgi:ankyrin repeat protein